MAFSIDAGSMEAFVHKRVDTFSGGMKRRLNLAIGLLNEPDILYLDEPTVGVDAQSRNYILETIRKINRERGTTVIYTSHYMDEIEQVADDIAVIDAGQDRPARQQRGPDDARRCRFDPSGCAADRSRRRDRCGSVPGCRWKATAFMSSGTNASTKTWRRSLPSCGDQGIRVNDVLFGQRTLEALFLKLTSSRLRDEEEQNG